MNYRQERKLNMYLLLSQFVSGTSTSVLNAMPNFSNLFGDFTAEMDLLDTYSGRQQLQRGGSQVQKNFVREELATMGALISNKLKSYASNINDDVLYAEVDYVRSSLLKCTETLCVTRCVILYEKATEHLTALADYGITDGILDGFRDQYQLFDSMIPNSQQGVANKKVATEDMLQSFRVCDALLGKMTLLVSMLPESHPEFYADYMSMRRMNLPPYRTLSARGVVVDGAGTGVGLVRMVCEALGYTHRISRSGGFYLRNMPDGVYEFSFSRPGYQTVVQELTFYRGIRDEVRVVLPPV